MVKHVISVCIFCFICATHAPCASHAAVSLDSSPIELYIEDNNFSPYADESGMQERYNNDRIIRKRNAKDEHYDDAAKNADDEHIEIDKYLKKLFEIYGDGDTMSLKGFEKLMHELNAAQDLSSKLELSGRAGKTEEEHVKTNIPVHNQSSSTNHNHTCILKEEIADFLRVPFKSVSQIDDNTFKRACPAVLYSILTEDCNTHYHHHHHHRPHEEVLTNTDERMSTTMIYVYSSVAVIVISLCGVLGLFVIPIMQTTYYHKILQFLVALAVGTLAGDALLHLLPHAMSSTNHGHMHTEEHAHDHSHEHENLYKGLVAMMGLVLFFFMERFITILANWRKQRQLKDKLPKRLKVMSNEGSAQLTNAADKQCKHKYSSFPYCYDEITVIDIPREDRGFRLAGGAESVIDSHNNTQTTTLDDIESHSDLRDNKSSSFIHRRDIEANQNMTECPNDVTNGNCTEINKMLTHETGKDDTDSLEYTVILTEHENKHHGHSHAHGHVHSAPKNLSSVVWMVIMGDGLHNFTDGMAIGTAFSNSLSGGISTTVAVFCHELPHELGDFAMLLKAGMSVKQAVLYNLLSSILCIMGNWVGLWLGNTEYASTWVFAAAAGMFLYIALVDMLPELSSDHNGENTLYQCVLHLGGLLSGFGIMALIALYEHDLKSMFND